MKLRIGTLLVILGLSAAWLLTPTHHLKPVIASSEAATPPQSSDNPCEFPNSTKGMSDAEVVWRLFVAATCPVANDPNAVVAWEKWQVQSQVFPPATQQLGAPPPSRFNPSVLQQIMNPPKAGLLGLNLSTANCAPGNHPAYPHGPKRTICEEVRLNPEAASYITSNGLQTHAGQGSFVQKNGPLDFPVSAVELKADWIQLASMDPCDHPPQNPTVHVEKATDSTKNPPVTHCYALAGIHINSKLAPNWIWATWEPQDDTVNPMRCYELGCNDPWGANPAAIPAKDGAPRKRPTSNQTPAITALMKKAGLAPEWFNYRLDGVQGDYVDKGNPTLLGNSVTEAESVGLDLTQASCITCHNVSSVTAQGAEGAGLLKGANGPIRPIGLPDKWPPPLGSPYIRRDFVWTFVVASSAGVVVKPTK